MKDVNMHHSTNKGDDDDDDDDDNVYIVSVDSRGRSASDLEAYKEYTCPRSFFNENIADEPKVVCVPSEMAELCGIRLKIYFFESDLHRGNHDNSDDDNVHNKINAAGTVLTFDPTIGHTQHKIYGKAYIIWGDGTKPLSKRQVWGIHELIKEGRELYYSVKANDPTDYTHLRKAKLEIMGWCAQYEAGTWSPHAIYEPRHPHHHHHHHHHPQNQKEIHRGSSGVSDQATYHHGEGNAFHRDQTHHHHNLGHKSGLKKHHPNPATHFRRDVENRGPFQEEQPRDLKRRNPLQSLFSACRAAY